MNTYEIRCLVVKIRCSFLGDNMVYMITNIGGHTVIWLPSARGPYNSFHSCPILGKKFLLTCLGTFPFLCIPFIGQYPVLHDPFINSTQFSTEDEDSMFF